MKRRHILKSVSGLAASGITLGKVGGDILEVKTNTVGNVDEEVLEVILESQTLEQLRSDFSYTVLETDAAEYKSVEIERETGETSGWRCCAFRVTSETYRCCSPTEIFSRSRLSRIKLRKCS